MNLKKFNDMITEREGFDDIDQPFRETPFMEDSPYEFFHDEEEDDREDDLDEVNYNVNDEDVIENLLSTLRKIVKNSGFKKAYVFFEEEDSSINIQFVLNKTENMNNIMKIMNLLKKLESDILIQYNAEFDLWETKQGDPLLTGKFFYDEDVTSSGEEDYIPDDQKEFVRKADKKSAEVLIDGEGSAQDYSTSSTKSRLNKIGFYDEDEPPF